MGLSSAFGLTSKTIKSVPQRCEIALVEHMVVSGDHVGITALPQVMTRQGKRLVVRGVSVMMTEVGLPILNITLQ